MTIQREDGAPFTEPASAGNDSLKQITAFGRKVATAAARGALECLAVNLRTPYPGMGKRQTNLRRRLVARARQIGCEEEDGLLDISRLADEIAYEKWHRMFFARFLADNGLLMYGKGGGAVPVTLRECGELAREERALSGWELAGRLAALMLPQIFRPDSPASEISFPPESRRLMESSLSKLPPNVFEDPGVLGDVYRFWRDPLDAESGHTAARGNIDRCKADFLTDNCVGPLWVAIVSGRIGGVELRPGAREALRRAETEDELRNFFSIPGPGGLSLKYMRFARVNGDDGNRWSPAAGWPESASFDLSSFKALDPCCGAGQILVSLFRSLVPMRMYLEGLPAIDAVDAVLRENIHGLERDTRCAQFAVFALAMSAWKYPGTGYRKLPELNIACSGLAVGSEKKDWENLATGRHNLRIALGMMYETFRDAPVLGSLIDPARSEASVIAGWEPGGEGLQDAIALALHGERGDEEKESAAAAQGLVKTAELLSLRYDLVAVNIPSLPRSRQDERLRKFNAKNYARAKEDLACAVIDRSLRFCAEGGRACFALPKNWFSGDSFKKYREILPDLGTCRLAVMFDEEKTALLLMSPGERIFRSGPDSAEINCVSCDGGDSDTARALYLGGIIPVSAKALRGSQTKLDGASGNPSTRKTARSLDDPARFIKKFWELTAPAENWRYIARPDRTAVELLSRAETGMAPRYPNQPIDSESASRDPSDWSFPGHPCAASGSDVLQTAAARLLGYRWPSENDPGIGLAPAAQEWRARCGALSGFAASDGIVQISSAPGEIGCADRLLDILAASFGEKWSNGVLSSLLASAGCAQKNLEFWLREKFFAQHCKLFKNRPFIWHVWDGEPDGFSALLNYHALGRDPLETLIYSHLGDWIRRLREGEGEGDKKAQKRLKAALRLKESLELILEGEAPYDIFIRWKPLEKQPAGWAPDIEDGVAINIRPFMSAPDVRTYGAGVLRNKPRLDWRADAGKDGKDSPWYNLAAEYGGNPGIRINFHHLRLAEKNARTV
ncbi:MAG: hypothetical protein LBS35_04135 [Synergistaceae bacterium]|jgi:hypothetical protein|nr:hypothetical protein [Synergistaceae bacterium]